MNVNGKRGLISSPFRQLGLHSSQSKSRKDRKEEEIEFLERDNRSEGNEMTDRGSIYSFESVNTSGRLLDRLDIESISLEKGEENLSNSRNSVIWIDSESSIVDDNISSFGKLTNSTTYKTAQSHPFDTRSPDIRNMNVKQLPLDIILKDSKSVESFKVDIKRASMSSYIAEHQSTNTSPSTFEERTDNENFNGSVNQRVDSIFGDDDSLSSSEVTLQSYRSQSSDENSTQAPHNENIFDETSSYSINSMGGSNFNEMPPEARIKLASQLRNSARYREASYQLQKAANVPNNHPKAMFLYALALRYGQGVKQSHVQSIKWLCKCLLVDTSTNSTTLIEKLNKLEPDILISLVNNAIHNPIDVHNLLEYYSNLPKAKLSKIVTHSKKQPNTSALAYHELGIALINGWGTPTKNEINGMNLLSKAASMGNANSMTKLGDLWCTKTKSHKKDLVKAAAWLRLSELFDVTAIGNSWIYKDKYMVRPRK